MIEEIQLLNNLEEVRFITLQNTKSNIFALIRRNQFRKEFVVKIGDIAYSEKDRAASPIMRIIAGNTRLYLHKNSKVQDFELLKAVFTPGVNKI